MRSLGLFSYRCAGCGQLARTTCEHCASKIALCPTPNCSDAIVALSYDGLVRDLMLAFKYQNHRTLATLFADHLVSILRKTAEINSIDVVTWVPTTCERRIARGHDQAETLARLIGRLLGIPVRKLLIRETVGHQTGKSRENRLIGISLRARSMNTPIKVLVVDDVVTTGATMRSAQRALYQAGAASVICAAVASTPAPAPRR